MGLYALDETYGLETWYDYNGANDLWAGTDLLLDQSRHILASDAYVFQGIAFPKGTDVEIDYQGTFSGSLNLVPYSYILGLTGFSGDGLQYNLRIYDKGAQTDLYYGQFAWYPTVMGTMQQSNNTPGHFLSSGEQNVPFGAYYFRDPLIVLPPGNIQIQITNSTPQRFPTGAMEIVQLLFLVAAPKNTVTLSTRRVQTSSDPSGLQSIGALANIIG